MCVIAVLSLVQEPAVRPNLGRPEHLLPGAQDDAHRFVVENEREACHTTRAVQAPCRSDFVLCPDVPTCYDLGEIRDRQSDTFSTGCAVSS